MKSVGASQPGQRAGSQEAVPSAAKGVHVGQEGNPREKKQQGEIDHLLGNDRTEGSSTGMPSV